MQGLALASPNMEPFPCASSENPLLGTPSSSPAVSTQLKSHHQLSLSPASPAWMTWTPCPLLLAPSSAPQTLAAAEPSTPMEAPWPSRSSPKWPEKRKTSAIGACPRLATCNERTAGKGFGALCIAVGSSNDHTQAIRLGTLSKELPWCCAWRPTPKARGWVCHCLCFLLRATDSK